jgi:hypothetical protein
MSFGKYRGAKLDDVPQDYLQWVLSNCGNISVSLREEIKRVLDIGQPQQPNRISTDTVAQWYRQMAREFHPDLRGSHDGMVAINRGKDVLLELVQ